MFCFNLYADHLPCPCINDIYTIWLSLIDVKSNFFGFLYWYSLVRPMKNDGGYSAIKISSANNMTDPHNISKGPEYIYTTKKSSEDHNINNLITTSHQWGVSTVITAITQSKISFPLFGDYRKIQSLQTPRDPCYCTFTFS